MAGASSYFSSSRRSPSALSSNLNVRVPDELLERLGKVGDAEHLGYSDTVRLVLERGLAASERGSE